MSTRVADGFRGLPDSRPAPTAAMRHRSALLGVFRAELRKLIAQLSTRVLALVCLLGPLAFALVLKLQSGLPADTLFGVWVHQSGFAVSLVVLGFAGSWGFPVIAGALAGDLFSGEDRHGTWKMILSRSVGRQDVFVGKLLAAALVAVALVVVTTVSSLIAGLLTAGTAPPIGLSGLAIPSAHALWLVLIAWGVSVLPLLGFLALAALLSLLTRNGIAGALAPVLVALIMQLLDLIGNGSVVHAMLLGSAFNDWHGLFVAHVFLQPLLVGSLVSVGWTLAAALVAWNAFRARDFAGSEAARSGWLRPGVIVLSSVALLATLAVGTRLGPPTITPSRLQASLTPAFSELTLLQQRELGRQVAAGEHLRIMPRCLRRGGTSSGPGDDWTCTLGVFIPQHGVEPFRQTAVTYDMSVESDGCYKASGPPIFIGQQTMRDARHAEVVNPLYTIYGCFETDG